MTEVFLPRSLEELWDILDKYPGCSGLCRRDRSAGEIAIRLGKAELLGLPGTNRGA